MKKNIVDNISLEMMHNKETVINSTDIFYSDEQLIDKIKLIDDINLKGAVDGRTLLIHSVVYKREKIFDFLLNSGANINLKDNAGFTALHSAVSSSNLVAARILLENGADVNAKDALGNTPLFNASQMDVEMIKLLLDNGADYASKNNFGISPQFVFQAYPEIFNLIKNYDNQSGETNQDKTGGGSKPLKK